MLAGGLVVRVPQVRGYLADKRSLHSLDGHCPPSIQLAMGRFLVAASEPYCSSPWNKRCQIAIIFLRLSKEPRRITMVQPRVATPPQPGPVSPSADRRRRFLIPRAALIAAVRALPADGRMIAWVAQARRSLRVAVCMTVVKAAIGSCSISASCPARPTATPSAQTLCGRIPNSRLADLTARLRRRAERHERWLRLERVCNAD